jgi:DNA-binding Xre family transcriptional regulator
MVVYNDIIHKINRLSIDKKLTRTSIAKGTGMNRTTLYNYFDLKTIMPLDEFLRVCEFLEVSPSFFFEENKERKNINSTDIDKVFEAIKQLVKERIK